MPSIDPFASITGAILDLLTRDGDLFLSLGMNLYRGIAIILLAWFGIRAALTSAERGSGFPFGAFASLLLTIAFGLAMITYYRAPLPGIGRSFTQLLTDQPIFLARQLEVTQVQRLSDRLADLYLSLEQPTVFNVSALVGYFLVALAVTAARVALVAVIAFGLAATGVAVLVGPVFIPFFLVPQMDWMFWGWLKSLLQYAFYQVIAQAFVFVFGTFLTNFLDAFPPPYTIDRLLVGGFHLVFLLVAFVYGLLKVPSLTNSLFAGRSGESSLPRISGLTMATTPTLSLPPTGYEYGEARRRYVEAMGSTQVMNTYLKLTVLGLAVVAVALVLLNVHTQRTFRTWKPLVIRIDDVGHAAAVSYDSLTYTPQAPELKYFLVQFVTKHYSRIRATVRQSYAESFYFLDGRLADATMDANKKSGLIERFLTGTSEEVEVKVKNVTLDDLRQPPYRATIDFDEVHLAPATRTEIRRDSFVAHVVFVIKDQVDNARIPINPLGLTITYFREDQAFVAEPAVRP